jgi:hypothetical protein
MPSAYDEARASDAVTSMSVRYAWARPWHEQWWLALWSSNQVARCYAGRTDGPGEANGWGALVREACIALCHVRDWLEHDTAVPLTRGQLRTIVRRSRCLQLVTDVANTSKHHTRQGNQTTARIEQITINGVRGEPQQGIVSIAWRSVDGRSGQEDALDLIRGAVADWRGVFITHGIPDPYPTGVSA